MSEHVTVEQLESFCVDALKACEVGEDNARATAALLVLTDSWGVFTHGSKLLIGYAKRLTGKGLKGKKKARAGKPLRVKVGVLVDGFAPDGVVSILDGSKTLKRLRIARGTKKVKLPKLSKGKHVLTAVYAGSDATEGSRSKTLKVRVLPRR